LADLTQLPEKMFRAGASGFEGEAEGIARFWLIGVGPTPSSKTA
jgi:hypothetical protein